MRSSIIFRLIFYTSIFYNQLTHTQNYPILSHQFYFHLIKNEKLFKFISHVFIRYSLLFMLHYHIYNVKILYASIIYILCYIIYIKYIEIIIIFTCQFHKRKFKYYIICNKRNIQTIYMYTSCVSRTICTWFTYS